MPLCVDPEALILVPVRITCLYSYLPFPPAKLQSSSFIYVFFIPNLNPIQAGRTPVAGLPPWPQELAAAGGALGFGSAECLGAQRWVEDVVGLTRT